MRNLRSEVLFNRALIWLVLAELEALHKPDAVAMIVLDLVLVVYNMWKSFKAWEG